MARERRTESVLAWVGAGAVAGALLLALVTVGLHGTGRDDGLFATAGWGWFLVCLIGGFTLMQGVRWKREHAEHTDDAMEPEAGWDYVVSFALVAALVWLIAGHGALLGADADADGFSGLAPSELRMGIVVCATALGLLLMLTVVRRPLFHPRARSLPSFSAGVLAVVLVGVTAPVLTGIADESDDLDVRHAVAEDPPETAPVPDRVREAGWRWEPDGLGTIDRIVRGAHGPLVVLREGVVSLDGTDGTEVWSYRRPVSEEPVSVWVGNSQAYVTHTPKEDPDPDSDGSDSDGSDSDGSDGDGSDSDGSDGDGDQEPRVTEVFDLTTGELLTEYTRAPNEGSDEGGDVLGWSDGIRVRIHHDDHALPWGMSAWKAESGEELWFQGFATEEGSACEGRSPRVFADTVVYAVVCVDEDDLAGPEPYSQYINLDHDVPSEFRIVSVDLRTGQERWSYERDDWEEAFLPGRPRVAPGGADGEDALVVLRHWRDAPGLLLDPDTGEELLHLSEEVLEDEALEDDEDLRMERVLDADADGATVHFQRGTEGSEFHRVDTDGNRTELVGAGGVYLDSSSENHVVLADQVLNYANHYSQYEERAQILVSSPGERLGHGLDNRIALAEQKPVEQLVAVPGGVAVLTGGRLDAHVEGLVP
ncbi:hypothetical protein [Nocardiopsis oceani]